MYNVLILAGPSAAGKTTVAEALLSNPDTSFELVRSLTTRKRRGDGFDEEYLYTDRAGFEKRLLDGGILEYTEYAGEMYGTPHSEIERIDREGKTPLLILDMNGVRSLKAREDILNVCAIYVYCDYRVLSDRLARRYLCGEPSEADAIRYEKRMAQNFKDFSEMSENAELFYALVENVGSVENASASTLGLLEAFLNGVPRESEQILSQVEKIKKSLPEI